MTVKSAKLIIPLLNKKVFTFPGPSWYLDEDIYLDTFNDYDFGSFHRDASVEYTSQVGIKTKCIHFNCFPGNNVELLCREVATISRFVFNVFAFEAPIILGWAAYFEEKRINKLKNIIDLEAIPNVHRLREQTFKFTAGNKRETITGFYKITRAVCKNNPAVLFALDRYNSCMVRSGFTDKIVDATISLESLIRGTSEVRFRFALYNSFIYAEDPSKRYQSFRQLLKLYDARSGIVHGSITERVTRRNICYLEHNWEYILDILKASLIYYLIYLKGHPIDSWDEHQKNLVFGLEKRIID